MPDGDKCGSSPRCSGAACLLSHRGPLRARPLPQREGCSDLAAPRDSARPDPSRTSSSPELRGCPAAVPRSGGPPCFVCTENVRGAEKRELWARETQSGDLNAECCRISSGPQPRAFPMALLFRQHSQPLSKALQTWPSGHVRVGPRLVTSSLSRSPPAQASSSIFHLTALQSILKTTARGNLLASEPDQASHCSGPSHGFPKLSQRSLRPNNLSHIPPTHPHPGCLPGPQTHFVSDPTAK